MTLEEMRKIADARTMGEWRNLGPEIRTHTSDNAYMNLGIMVAPRNAEFIAMAANNFDKLLAVVEAARNRLEADHHDSCSLDDDECTCGHLLLRLAIEELEKV